MTTYLTFTQPPLTRLSRNYTRGKGGHLFSSSLPFLSSFLIIPPCPFSCCGHQPRHVYACFFPMHLSMHPHSAPGRRRRRLTFLCPRPPPFSGHSSRGSQRAHAPREAAMALASALVLLVHTQLRRVYGAGSTTHWGCKGYGGMERSTGGTGSIPKRGKWQSRCRKPTECAC